MNYIPTLFRRHAGDSRIYPELTPGCEWVVNGEGLAYRMWDGISCKMINSVLYRHHTVRPEKTPPPQFISAGCPDPNGNWRGWVPVFSRADTDKCFVEAITHWHKRNGCLPPEGTYELCGPKVQGNPYKFDYHILIPHTFWIEPRCPRTYGNLGLYLETTPIMGVVWTHPDGRMAQVKARDYGLMWPR
jgi:hypothetical protein